MKFILIDGKIYSMSSVQTISLRGKKIVFNILDGAKTKVINVAFEEGNQAERTFRDFLLKLKNSGEIFKFK